MLEIQPLQFREQSEDSQPGTWPSIVQRTCVPSKDANCGCAVDIDEILIMISCTRCGPLESWCRQWGVSLVFSTLLKSVMEEGGSEGGLAIFFSCEMMMETFDSWFIASASFFEFTSGFFILFLYLSCFLECDGSILVTPGQLFGMID